MKLGRNRIFAELPTQLHGEKTLTVMGCRSICWQRREHREQGGCGGRSPAKPWLCTALLTPLLRCRGRLLLLWLGLPAPQHRSSPSHRTPQTQMRDLLNCLDTHSRRRPRMAPHPTWVLTGTRSHVFLAWSRASMPQGSVKGKIPRTIHRLGATCNPLESN